MRHPCIPLVALLLSGVTVRAEEEAPAPVASMTASLWYGPYLHLLKSKEEAALVRRAGLLFRALRGVYQQCTRCGGDGTIRVVVREAFYAADGTLVPAVYRTETCPTCNGERIVFYEDIATAAFEGSISKEDRRHVKVAAGRAEFVAMLRDLRQPYTATTAKRSTVDGISGDVPSSPFPWRLAREGGAHVWCLHLPAMHGARPAGSGIAPSSDTVSEVPAADILVLQSGTVVRLCGIAIPQKGPTLPRPDVDVANTVARDLVRGEMNGKTVTLSGDKYSAMDCDGHPLVYVQLDGKDYAEDLLRRGVARLHPKHRHERWPAYQKAESAARSAKAGIWAAAGG